MSQPPVESFKERIFEKWGGIFRFTIVTRYVFLLLRNFGTLYVFVFSAGVFEKVNNLVLRLALKAKGFNNYENRKVTGEEFFIENVLKKMEPRVCVDVGANIGDYARILLSSTNAKVFSFEPLNEPYKVLKQLTEPYGERFVAINKGVGLKNDSLIIHFSDEATEHASFSEEVKNVSYVKNDLAQNVDVVSLDSFFLETFKVDALDFIKIDTEGFEYEVLLGASKVISSFRPMLIQIEFNWHQLFKGKSLYLFSGLLADYVVYQMLPGKLVRRDPKDPYSNIFQFSNFVFVRKDMVNRIGFVAETR